MAGKDIQARLTELNENEILLYLGYRGQKYPAEVEAQIKRCEKDVLAAADLEKAPGKRRAFFCVGAGRERYQRTSVRMSGGGIDGSHIGTGSG